MRRVKGPWRAPCQLQGSEMEARELPGGTEVNSISLARSHWFALQANQWLFYKMETVKNWVSGPTWNDCGWRVGLIRGLLVFNGQTLGLLFGGYRQTGQTPIDAWSFRVLLFIVHAGGNRMHQSGFSVWRVLGINNQGGKDKKNNKIEINIKYISLYMWHLLFITLTPPRQIKKNVVA